MVSELESFPESWGPKSTVLFLNDFLLFEQEANNNGAAEAEEEEEEGSTALAIRDSTSDAQFDANNLPKFLEWPEYDYWKGFLKLKTER